ncbi:MAG: M16 family metallopeptidase, partial [Candidatus Dormibacteria bacterium]
GGRFPTARAVSEAIEGVGGVLNAATDREATVFWTRVPATQFELAVSVLADMLLRPAFDPAEVVKERQVVIEELRMYQDSPQDFAQIVFDEVMWPDHALGRDVAGREETVRTFTGDQCRTHVDMHVRPETLVVSVAGGVSADHAAAVVAAELQDWAQRRRPERTTPEAATAPHGPVLRVARRTVEQASLLLGARSLSYLDPDRFALDLLNVVLGEGMSSRLFLELRERRGYVYDVHSFVSRLRDTGVFGMGLGCEPRRARVAMRAAIAELERLVDAPVEDAELHKAREYAKGRLLLQLESTSTLCEYAGQQLLLTGTVLEPAEVVARYDAITAADVQRVAQRTSASGLRAAIVGPFRSEQAFEALLLDVKSASSSSL